jgi:hypothetical protein
MRIGIENMREVFKDILSIDGIKGVLLVSFSGKLLFKEFGYALQTFAEKVDWRDLVDNLEGMQETDLIFEKGRVYIRRTELGYLIIFMGLFTPIAILRLNCDIVMPSLVPSKPSRRWGRFLRKSER